MGTGHDPDLLRVSGEDGEIWAWLDDHKEYASMLPEFAYRHLDGRHRLTVHEVVGGSGSG